MTKIEMTISGAKAFAAYDGAITTGMIGVPVTFSFDSAWDGLNIIAVFRCGGVTKDRALIGTSQTTVPWEVLQRRGDLEIGAEGRNADGSVVIPTVWARVGTILPGANASADPGAEPSPTMYDEIMTAVGNLNALQTQARENLVAAINELVEADANLQARINEAGHLILTLPNGNTIDAGYAVGPQGVAGADGADGQNGADGADGVTPHIGANGNWWIGNIDTGVKVQGPQGPQGLQGNPGANGANGADGVDGADGYTPQRGVDYWTQEDITQLQDYIDRQLGVIENGSY